MKTWEMIKAFSENPNLVFVNKRLEEEEPSLRLKFMEGILVWTKDSKHPYDSEFTLSKLVLNDDWAVVEE